MILNDSILSMHPCWRTHKSSMISKALSKSPDPAWPELRQCSPMPLPCATAAGRGTIQTCRGVIGSQANHKGTIIQWKSLKCVCINLHYTLHVSFLLPHVVLHQNPPQGCGSHWDALCLHNPCTKLRSWRSPSSFRQPLLLTVSMSFF